VRGSSRSRAITQAAWRVPRWCLNQEAPPPRRGPNRAALRACVALSRHAMVQKVACPFPVWFAPVEMANSTARTHSPAAPARAAHREYLAMLPAAFRACALFPRAVVEPKRAFPYPVTCARVALAGSHAIGADCEHRGARRQPCPAARNRRFPTFWF